MTTRNPSQFIRNFTLDWLGTCLREKEQLTDAREATFGADIGDIVVNHVLQGSDVRITELREVCRDVVIELGRMSKVV